jgi:hypothetical protein
MLTMTKPKPKPGRQPDPGPKKPTRTGKPINVWLPAPLRDALDAYVDSLRPEPSTTAVVVVALEEYLSRVGFWPPPADPSP